MAHLSTDTKSVDVQLTALAGGAVVYELDDVAYGAVSPYIPLADGTYVVSMVPSDAADGTQPVVQQSIDIAEGEPLTVAAYGRNADLTTTVFEDDLSAPAEGEARVRVVQASTWSRASTSTPPRDASSPATCRPAPRPTTPRSPRARGTSR